MPADWNLPQITSHYAVVVLPSLHEKVVDAATMFRGGAGSNMPVNVVRFNGDLAGLFERWNGTTWNAMLLGLTGGGTGAATAAGARANLGIGSLGVQDSAAVAITGGSITGLASLTVAGTVTANLFAGSGASLTALNAAELATGIVPTARLGGGIANSSSFLRGDQQWAAPLGTFPAGGIVLFDVACPAGWTRFTPLDGRFPRGSSAYGATGGSSTHTHSAGSYSAPAHTHGAGSYTAASHDHGAAYTSVDGDGGEIVVNDINSSSPDISGTSSSGGGGSITGTSGSTDHTPLYVDMVYCKKD